LERRVADLFERGALELDATLVALQEGRVRTLLHAAGFEPRGGECPRCGAPCRYCATRLVPLDDLVGRVVARADAAGAEVDTVHGAAASRLLDRSPSGARTACAALASPAAARRSRVTKTGHPRVRPATQEVLGRAPSPSSRQARSRRA
jgi:hypothetical protein